MNEFKNQIATLFGKRIAALRKEKGISLRELEKRTGIANSNLCDIENGKKNATITTLARIADAIGCHISIAKGRK